MKLSSTFFLKAAVLTMGLGVLGLCALILPAIYSGWGKAYPEVASLRYPVLIGLSLTAVAFFVAQYHTLKLLRYIDKNTAFSALSVRSLTYIKYCAIVIGVLYMAGMPVVYHATQEEDAPGLMIIGMAFIFASFVISVFAAVLQKLLKSAIAIKSENELTV